MVELKNSNLNSIAEHFTYRVTAQVIPVEKVNEIARRRTGKFILATNVLNHFFTNATN